MHPTTLVLSLVTSTTMAMSMPVVIMPDADACTPTSYTISNYTLTTSPSSGTVAFTFKSTFSGSGGTDIIDLVQNGARCSASGPFVPNANVCEVPDRRLLFNLRGPQEQAYYQVTHTWTCGGSTWMSGNEVKMDPLDCHTEGETRICTGGPMTLTPQNVRMVCGTPTC